MSGVSPQLISLDAPTLVEASAGTGKTHTITTYFVRAILENDLSPEQILVLTYTKAATAELRARARERIIAAVGLLDTNAGNEDVLRGVVANAVERLGRRDVAKRLRTALGEMDRAAILTIHGFCQRLLQDYPLLFGIDFDFEVSDDVASMDSDLAVDFWAAALYDAPDWLLRALENEKVNAKHLAQLVNVARMPGIELLGPAPSEVDEDALKQWLQIKQEVAGLWREHRDEVLEILLNDKGLDGRQYQKRTVTNTWRVELDDFFAKTRFRFPPSFIDRLAQGNMRTKAAGKEPTHPFFEACGRLWEVHERLIPGFKYAVFAFRERFIRFARDQARNRRENKAVFTFDDLLATVYAPLVPSQAQDRAFEPDVIANTVATAYPLALVDEFQDTDSVQYGIFRAIYGESSAVYVGDPKQAIYAFRGADVFSYLGAVKDVGDRKHSLTTNWRSDAGVVHAINTLFSLQERPFILDGIGMEHSVPHYEERRSSFDAAMELVFLDQSFLGGPIAEAVAPIVANEIALLLGSNEEIENRPVEPGDIAVLCRSNVQAVAVTGALRALGISVSLDGDSSVSSTEIASDLSAVLEAALMPGDASLVRRALLTPLLGVSPYELSNMTDELWSDWVSRFREWNETWHSQGVVRFVEDMLRSTEVETRIARQVAARRTLTDLLHIEELLMRGERERRRDPIALMHWFRRLKQDGSSDGAIASEELQQRPDAESGAIRVSTIHKSKGLEYPIVYCPFTTNDAALRGFDHSAVKFHDEQHNIKIDLGSENKDAHKRISEAEALSEALRLLYVAVTRAKYRCTLYWGPAHNWKKSALAYLLHGKPVPEKVTQDEMEAAVEELAASSSGAIAWRFAYPERAAPHMRQAPTRALSARVQTRFFTHAPRIASFTSLTGHDEKTPGPRASVAMVDPSLSLFSDLPGGVRTGLLLHSILEHANFQELETDETRRLIERELRGFGFDTSLAAAVQADLQSAGGAALTADLDAPRLMDLPRDAQLRELEFTLSVDRPRLADLAALLKEHRAPSAAPTYYERLEEVSSQTLQRFLRGYIDLMFQWQGRWYVADYKSNTLPAYDPAATTEAVQREHYLLQAQLYTAAAQRHLKQQVPGYDPETDWGGALFLFLRGMRESERAGASVFFDRQPAALLSAVDLWLGGGGNAR
jgi:exodeoxyribonuclease V beta subunit